jgi:uncharacterized membrane protein
MRLMESYTVLGVLFLALGVAAIAALSSPILGIIMIVVAIAMIAQAQVNTRRRGPMGRE